MMFRRYLKIIAAAIFVTALAAGAAFAAPALGDDVYTRNPIAKIARDASPAVVNIDTETMVKQRGFSPFGGGIFGDDPFFREFFGDFERYNKIVPMHGKGSGFIVDRNGHILTNNHVVSGADKITVTMMDGRRLDAELVGSDATFDLAVIKVKERDLPFLQLGDSDKAQVGEWVVAIGNPHGFEHTVTAGIISGKNRTVQAADVNFSGFMQTDAAINPGNSGGPLIDLDGSVVGINTAIVPYAQGIGFAVPVNMAKQIMSDLIEHGSVRRGWIGVSLQTLTPVFAETYGVPTSEGAIVADIVAGSPSERAGFRRGDVITAVDGEAVKNSQDVVLKISAKLAGDKVRVDIYRDGRKRAIDITLGERPSDLDGERQERPRPSKEDDKDVKEVSRLGMTVVQIDPKVKARLRIKPDRGVVVTDVDRGSPAASIGVRPGDVIVEANRKKINTLRDLEQSIKEDATTVVLLISRGDQTLFFSYKK